MLRLTDFALILMCCWALTATGCAKKEVVRTDLPSATAPSLSAPARPTAATSPGVAAARNVAVEAASSEDEKIAVDGAPEGAARIPSELKRIHFEFDSYLLTAQARDTLAGNAEVLTEGPQVKVKIAGHCDERGSDEYNLALSDKRARAAREYLIGLGVPRERLSVIGYGKERPVAPGHDEANWAQNRRDEFEVTP